VMSSGPPNPGSAPDRSVTPGGVGVGGSTVPEARAREEVRLGACGRLGHRAEARAELAAAVRLIEQGGARDALPRTAWHDDLRAQILRGEAQALILDDGFPRSLLALRARSQRPRYPQSRRACVRAGPGGGDASPGSARREVLS
jgi:hypothetical protein